jgi:hypothetical protein
MSNMLSKFIVVEVRYIKGCNEVVLPATSNKGAIEPFPYLNTRAAVQQWGSNMGARGEQKSPVIGQQGSRKGATNIDETHARTDRR